MHPGLEPLPAISDRFTLLRRVGSGGVGIVYEAFDREQRARVALKTLRDVNPGRIYLLKQEFRALTGLIHPNLVQLFELISDGDQWYFTMEYVDGVDFLRYVRGDPVTESDDQETLSSLFTTIEITPGSPPGTPPQQALRSLRALERPDQFARLRRALPQLVEGVQTLHEAGKLHRDLKPSNVLVTRAGRVAILDFGLVTDLPGTFAGREGSVFSGGTRGYMSPEQVRAQELTPASDWYSVGVMLYQTLMGGLPSNGSPPFSRLVPPALRSLCMRLLALDPEARPRGPDILRGLGEIAPAHHQAASVFVGRAEQYAALESALEALREGRPRAIYISGPSGMGKSELVRRFLEQAATETDTETLILTGTCREQESVPYKALDGVIDSLSRFLGKIPAADRPSILPRDTAALARAFPVLRSVITVPDIAARSMESADPLELRRRVFAALRDLFGRLGDRMPVVIYIDDLQWGDIDSAALLADLMRLPDAPRVLLIATYRSESAESNTVLQTLFAGARESSIERREITLGPLSLEETESLVESLAPGVAGTRDLAARFWNEAAGSPYLIRELGQALAIGESLEPGETTLESVLWTRISSLAPGARLLLELVAISGQPLRQAEIYAAAGSRERDPGALAVLRAGRLVRTGARGSNQDLQPYHDRVREVVAARLDPAVRRERHRSLALALESLGGRSAETLAVHFQGAGEAAKAVHYYSSAADEAFDALAFRHAAELYRLARDLAGSEDSRCGALETRLAESLANSGRASEAADVYLSAASHPGPATLELERRAAYHYCSTGRVEQGLAVFRKVLAALDLKIPATPRQAMWEFVLVRLRLQLRGTRFRLRTEDQIAPAILRQIDVAWAAGTALGTIDLITGALFTARSLLLALKVGEAHRLARALPWEAITSAAFGSLGKRRATRLLALCGPLAEKGSPHARGMLAMCTGLVEFVNCRFAGAIRYLSEGARIFQKECVGEYWGLAHCQNIIANSLLMLGSWKELNVHAADVLRQAQERGDLYTEVSIASLAAHIPFLCDGEPETARRTIDRFQARWIATTYQFQHALAALSRTDIFLYAGEGAEGVAFLDAEWPRMQRAFFSRNEWFRTGLFAGRARCALAAAAKSPEYLEVARRDLRRLERESMPIARPHAAAIRAGLQFLQGDRAAAIDSLGAAEQAAAALGMRLFQCAAALRRAQLTGNHAEEAIAAFRAEAVTDPIRMSRLFVAGLPD